MRDLQATGKTVQPLRRSKCWIVRVIILRQQQCHQRATLKQKQEVMTAMCTAIHLRLMMKEQNEIITRSTKAASADFSEIYLAMIRMTETNSQELQTVAKLL